jgi:transcriptional regulator with XRE-family HTH domain
MTESRGREIGLNLRRIREAALLSRADLARLAGMSEQGVEKIEAGRVARPRRGTVHALAKALGVDDSELAGKRLPDLVATGGGSFLGDEPSKQFVRLLREMLEEYAPGKPLEWSRVDLVRVADRIDEVARALFISDFESGHDDRAQEVAMLSLRVRQALLSRLEDAPGEPSDEGRAEAKLVDERLARIGYAA